MESVEASVDSIEVSLALLVLASFHSSGHVLLVGSDVSFSSLGDSYQHGLAHLHHSSKGFLVGSYHLLNEGSLVAFGVFASHR